MIAATIVAYVLAGVFTAAVLWVGKSVPKLLREWRQFHDEWSGCPAEPGVDAEPGVMERLQRIETLLKIE